MQVTVQFDPSNQAEVQRAIDAVMRHGSNGGTAPTPAPATRGATPAPVAEHDVVRLRRQMKPNESPLFLEALTDKPLTFAELAKRMPKKGSGQLRSNAEMRAIHRNVKRQEKTLRRRGTIQGEVVKGEFAAYDVEGVGRYSLAPDALKALDAHLGR